MDQLVKVSRSDPKNLGIYYSVLFKSRFKINTFFIDKLVSVYQPRTCLW